MRDCMQSDDAICRYAVCGYTICTAGDAGDEATSESLKRVRDAGLFVSKC